MMITICLHCVRSLRHSIISLFLDTDDLSEKSLIYVIKFLSVVFIVMSTFAEDKETDLKGLLRI